MTEEQSARLLPQKPPDGPKFYLTERFPFFCSSYWNWPFLSFSYLSLQGISIHYLMGTLVECLYLLLLAQSFHGFSFQTVLG